MRNQQVIKLFLVIILSTTYIFSFSHFGALAYDSVINRSDEFAEGTTIGSVSVAGKTRNEAMKMVDEQLTDYLNETKITLKYKEKSEAFDLGLFHFDVENSVSKAKHGQVNSVIVKLDTIEDVLISLSPSILDDIHLDEVQAAILNYAENLEPGNYEIRLDPYLTGAGSETTIAESVIKSQFVENELDLFTGKSIEIPATSQFSLLKYVEDEIGAVSQGSLSKIATAIYDVILPTNFDIIERHISSELPAYASLGFEAKADIDLKNDLVFSNPNEFSYFIEFENKNDSLYVSLKGPEFLNKYVIISEDKETFKPKIIRQFNPMLGPTEIKVKVAGKEGQLIKIYREHRDEKGAVLKKELIAEDFYPPVHQVEVQGLIVKEGDSSTTIPNTDNGQVENQDGSSSSPNNSEDSSDPNSKTDPNNPDASNDNELWGKENEIPK